MSRALSSLFQLFQSIIACDSEAATSMQAARLVALTSDCSGTGTTQHWPNSKLKNQTLENEASSGLKKHAECNQAPYCRQCSSCGNRC